MRDKLIKMSKTTYTHTDFQRLTSQRQNKRTEGRGCFNWEPWKQHVGLSVLQQRFYVQGKLICFHSTVYKQSWVEFRLQHPLISFMQSRIHRLITKPSIRGKGFLKRHSTAIQFYITLTANIWPWEEELFVTMERSHTDRRWNAIKRAPCPNLSQYS